MLGYNDVYTYLSDRLTNAKDYAAADLPLFNPGPPTIAKLQQITPNAMVFLTVGNGIGYAKEGVYDRPFIVCRVIGKQNDYDYAEKLAHDIDSVFFGVQNAAMGSTRTLYVTRNAPPQLVDFDAADRYHFQTTYIAEAQT